MQAKDYYQQDAHGLAKLIKTKELSPEEALEFALQRMQTVNPQLNAIITDCSAWGREQLKAMRGDEPFYGVPILVKDLGFALKNVPYTAGSRFFASTIPPLNCDFIDRLLAVGMVPIAKTNVPELGLSYVTESVLWGPCRNPYDLSRTPGGSSGGSAAAVAAGVVPVATASDGGGSIRIPAACCGLFGFKPSPGQISTGPYVAECWSGLAVEHVLTRTVRDSAALFEVLTADSPREALQQLCTLAKRQGQPRGLTIALPEGAFAPVPVAEPCRKALELTVELLRGLGHRVETQPLPLDLSAIGEAAITLIEANTWAEIEGQQLFLGRQVQEEELEPVTWEFMQRGKTISASQFIRARNRLYQLLRSVHELMDKVDLFLTPALAQLPLHIGSLPADDDFNTYLQKNVEFSPFTSLFNQAGLPAMTIPVTRHETLPLSVQFAAAKGRDRFLLDFAQYLQEQLIDFSQPILDLEG